MQRLKNRNEIANQIYVSKADIKKLLEVAPATAKRIYGYADEIDKNDEKMKYRIEPRKVRITSVAEVVGMSLNTLKRQAGAI